MTIARIRMIVCHDATVRLGGTDAPGCVCGYATVAALLHDIEGGGAEADARVDTSMQGHSVRGNQEGSDGQS